MVWPRVIWRGLVSSVSGRSHLRSAALGALVIPSSKLATVGERAFVVTCPRAWNLLPPDLRTADLGLLAFRKRLKTFLFNSHFQFLINSPPIGFLFIHFFADHVLRSFYESM